MQLELERLAALDHLVDNRLGRKRRAQIALVDGERHKVIDGELLRDRIEVHDAQLFLGNLRGRLGRTDLQAHVRQERVMGDVERLGDLCRGCNGGQLDGAVGILLFGNLHWVSPSCLKQSGTAYFNANHADAMDGSCGGRKDAGAPPGSPSLQQKTFCLSASSNSPAQAPHDRIAKSTAAGLTRWTSGFPPCRCGAACRAWQVPRCPRTPWSRRTRWRSLPRGCRGRT